MSIMWDGKEAMDVEEEFDPAILGLSGAKDGTMDDVFNQSDRRRQLLQTLLGDIASASIPGDKDTPHHTTHEERLTIGTRTTSYAYASADWAPDIEETHCENAHANPPSYYVKPEEEAYYNSYTDPSISTTLHEPSDELKPEPEPVIYRDYATGSPEPQIKIEPRHDEDHDIQRLAAEHVTLDETSISDKPSRAFRVVKIRARLVGRRAYRPGIRLIRPETPIPIETASAISTKLDHDTQPSRPPSPQRPPGYRGDLVQSFKFDTLSKLSLLPHDSPYLPPPIRTLFSPLSDPSAFLLLTNSLRTTLNLPRLRLTKKSRLPLIRIIARTRQTLFTELLSGLILPLAPVPAPGLTDEETTDEEAQVKEVRESIQLTPGNLEIMRKVLPKMFVEEKREIKAFLRGEEQEGVVGSGFGVYGEEKGKVVWQGGVGRVVGGEGGFRGKVGEGMGVHVFVDHSNILHGLLSALHPSTSPSLPPKHLRTLSLPLLSLLLRRGRPTPPGTLHLVASSPLHQPLDPLVRLGWEVSILKRVEVLQGEVEDPTSMHLTPKMTSGVLVGGAGGGDGVGIGRFKEQGVDEILHLKLLQALNAGGGEGVGGGGRGGTGRIVLATGDAKGGQFNRDGFLGAVREALRRGWEVELWSFSGGLSRAWYEVGKRERWFDRGFAIHELDEWAEMLVEVIT